MVPLKDDLEEEEVNLEANEVEQETHEVSDGHPEAEEPPDENRDAIGGYTALATFGRAEANKTEQSEYFRKLDQEAENF